MGRGSKVSSYNLSAHYRARTVNNVRVSVKSSVNVLSPETIPSKGSRRIRTYSKMQCIDVLYDLLFRELAYLCRK